MAITTQSKIRGILAISGVTMEELGALCGLTRQTIHTYLNVADIETFENGIRVMDTANKLMALANNGSLPMVKQWGKLERLEYLKSLVL